MVERLEWIMGGGFIQAATPGVCTSTSGLMLGRVTSSSSGGPPRCARSAGGTAGS